MSSKIDLKSAVIYSLSSRRVVKLSQTLVSFPSNIILPSWDTVLGIVDYFNNNISSTMLRFDSSVANPYPSLQIIEHSLVSFIDDE